MSDLYRCGWCGQPCDKDGVVLTLGQIAEKGDVDWNDADQTHGYCCIEQQEADIYMEVTRDMATDAGMPELEGQLVKWG